MRTVTQMKNLHALLPVLVRAPVMLGRVRLWGGHVNMPDGTVYGVGADGYFLCCPVHLDTLAVAGFVPAKNRFAAFPKL